MQLKLDFSGKKTERIAFAASEDLKQTLDKLTTLLKRESVSELVQEYVIECAFRDMGKLALIKARGEKLYIDIP